MSHFEVDRGLQSYRIFRTALNVFHIDFITRWNLKITISILIFTFYIVNQISIIIKQLTGLLLLIFTIKSCLTSLLLRTRARPRSHDRLMFCIETWTAKRMLVSSKAIAKKKKKVTKECQYYKYISPSDTTTIYDQLHTLKTFKKQTKLPVTSLQQEAGKTF